MDIIFVSCGFENLGVEYLSAALKQKGFSAGLVNIPSLAIAKYSRRIPGLCKTMDLVVREIENYHPKAVAFSSNTLDYPYCSQIAEKIKGKQATSVIFGGPHPTLIPEIVINNKAVDYVITGEAESQLPRLAECLLLGKGNIKDIDNLWYKQNGETKTNAENPYLIDIDALPLPDKGLYSDLIKRSGTYNVISSRGCRYSCSFCYSDYMNSKFRNFYRRRKPEKVIEELGFMHEKFRFKKVYFFDSNFATDKDWLDNFLQKYREKINLPFSCEGHVSTFSEAIAGMLRASGCRFIDFGIQTMSERLRNSVLKRPESNAQIKRALDICEKEGIKFFVDHLFNIPGEQNEDFLYSGLFYMNYRKLARIKCFNLYYFPQSTISAYAAKNNYIKPEDALAIGKGDTPAIKKYSFFNKKNFNLIFLILPVFPLRERKLLFSAKMLKLFGFMPRLSGLFFHLLAALRHKNYLYLAYMKEKILEHYLFLSGSVKLNEE